MNYRIGIVGCGGQGKAHAREWEQLENCSVVAVSDPLPEPLAYMAKHFPQARQYPDFRALLAAEELDILSIATWPDAHCEPTIMAAQRGVHVFCEKPMALDLRECDAMLEACDQHDVALVISHNRRNDPHYDKAKALIEEGLIGRVCRAHAADKGYEVGYGLMNIGTHIFDGLRSFFGDARSVLGHLTVDGRELEPGDINPQGPRGTGWVAGKEGVVLLSFEQGPVAVVEWDPEVNRFGVEIIGETGRLAFLSPGHELYHLPGPQITTANHDQWRKIELTPEENPYDYPARSTREKMLREMLAWIEGGPAHCSDGRAGRAAVEIIMAAYWSQIKRGWVDLPLAETRHPLEIWREQADHTDFVAPPL